MRSSTPRSSCAADALPARTSTTAKSTARSSCEPIRLNLDFPARCVPADRRSRVCVALHSEFKCKFCCSVATWFWCVLLDALTLSNLTGFRLIRVRACDDVSAAGATRTSARRATSGKRAGTTSARSPRTSCQSAPARTGPLRAVLCICFRRVVVALMHVLLLHRKRSPLGVKHPPNGNEFALVRFRWRHTWFLTAFPYGCRAVASADRATASVRTGVVVVHVCCSATTIW